MGESFFTDIMMECMYDVCGMSHVGGQSRNGSEW